MNMNKAHPSAASLYIGTGFAHMRSIVRAYGLYEKIKKRKKLQASSLTGPKGQCRMNYYERNKL